MKNNKSHPIHNILKNYDYSFEDIDKCRIMRNKIVHKGKSSTKKIADNAKELAEITELWAMIEEDGFSEFYDEKAKKVNEIMNARS